MSLSELGQKMMCSNCAPMSYVSHGTETVTLAVSGGTSQVDPLDLGRQTRLNVITVGNSEFLKCGLYS